MRDSNGENGDAFGIGGEGGSLDGGDANCDAIPRYLRNWNSHLVVLVLERTAELGVCVSMDVLTPPLYCTRRGRVKRRWNERRRRPFLFFPSYSPFVLPLRLPFSFALAPFSRREGEREKKGALTQTTKAMRAAYL